MATNQTKPKPVKEPKPAKEAKEKPKATSATAAPTADLPAPETSQPNPPATDEANTSPSAPSTSETPNNTAKDGNAPETGLSDDQAPNDSLQDALESFNGKSFVDLLRTIFANTEDPDEKEAAAELIDWLETRPNDEAYLAGQAIRVMLEQMAKQRQAVLNIPPVNLEAGIESTLESPLPESDEDRAERIRANAAAELEELKAESQQRAEAAQAARVEREAAGGADSLPNPRDK